MPNVSLRTFAIGARQLVVHDALEMTTSVSGLYVPSFTPITIVTSSPEAGAEMMTFLTLPPTCAFAASAFVKKPVDSRTIWAPYLSQSSAAGSRSARTANSLPSTEIECSPASTFPGSDPECCRTSAGGQRRGVSQVVDGNDLDVCTTRSDCAVKLRPIRPNPLIPTLIVTFHSL